MNRFMPALGVMILFAAPAAAQYPYSGTPSGGYPQPGFTPGTAPYAPNAYNRSNQPLSPYLNLLRGQGNPGIDYYYGVRPALQSAQPSGNNFGAGGGLNNSQMRTGYIPQSAYPTSEPILLPDAGKEVILPPSGHGVSYGNASGISRTGVPGANTNRQGFFAPPTTGTVQKKK